MRANVDTVAHELAALTQRFIDLGAKLGEAARALEEAGAPPVSGLVEALAGAREQFVELRAQTLSAADAAGVRVPGEPESLQDLQPMLAAIGEALRERARREALEHAQASAVAIIDRVLELVHRDDPAFTTLVGCHAKAREARQAVLQLTDLDSEEARGATAAVQPFSDLLTMVESRDAVDDERYAQLEQNVSRGFGRTLAVAAARGRLGFAGEIVEPLAPKPGPVIAAAPPEPARATDAGPEPEPVVAAAAAPATARGAGEASAPDETAQWWLAAWARWSGWKSSLAFADAVREEVAKYPYLLSVPILKSPEYEDGLLAYGYSILMDHVEKQNPGCVGNALNSLKPGQTRPIGQQLYDYLVDEGRLRETYADFVKDVLTAAVPEPGVWFQFRILESREDTRVLQRPSARVGDPELSGQRLASDGQRYAEHKLKMTLGPLTARFVLVSADVKEARGAGFKVVNDGAPSDAGWVVSVSPGTRPNDARRLAEEGTHLTGLGKDYPTVWVAVFNPDPGTDRHYELSIFLRKDAKSPFRAKG